MTLAHRDMPPKAINDQRLLAPVAIALRDSAFASRKQWACAVVILRNQESPRVASRADFAGWLAANGLHASARECVRRRMPDGAVLVWIEIDEDTISDARFVVFALQQALRAFRDTQ